MVTFNNQGKLRLGFSVNGYSASYVLCPIGYFDEDFLQVAEGYIELLRGD